MFWFLNPKCRDNIYQCVKNTWWKEKPIDINYVFPEAGLTLSRVFILSLPLGSFISDLFLAPLPHPIVLCLHLELQSWCLLCLFLPFSSAAVPSTVLLHVHRNKVYLCWWFSALNLKFTPQSDDHPSFHFIFCLARFNWVPSTASLSTSHEWWPDSRQHAMCQIKSQNHKWGFTAADSSTEKLSPALSLPFLPALFQQLPILPC